MQTPNNVDLYQREHPEILAGMREGEGIENVDFGVQNL